ncbi:MAG: sigma-70 family RNA polymerase sigma factor [Phycisphaerae bacterium]|nr:sigma-70 family RNA polymerase sigma factor [Phycisphaerae bacterium]
MESVEIQSINAARCGDAEAFGRLYESYYATMVWLAYAILLDRNLAEDAAQQAFVKACEKLGDLKNTSRFGAWLGRICRNEAYQMMRCRQRTQVSLPPQHEPAVADNPGNTDDHQQIVKAAVDRLPEMYREVIVLHYYQHLDYRQISTVLGIAEATVRGRLFRARRKIEKNLRKNGFMEGRQS